MCIYFLNSIFLVITAVKLSQMKLPLYTERMFSLIEYVLENNINGCKTQQHFFDSIKYGSSGNLTNIRNGVQSFRMEQYQNAINVYNLDANYFFVKDAAMFREGKNASAISKLREAVALVSRELQEKKNVTKRVTKNARKRQISVKVKNEKSIQ